MPTLYIADAERDADMKNLSRKEAAKVLEDMKSKGEIPKAAVTQWKRNTALDMAIEALKYSEVPNSSDCISRQAAIDAVAKGLKGVFVEYQDVAEKLLNNLPSAQPEPCEDAVSRETVKEQMLKYGFRAPDMTVTEFVEDCLPSVTPKQRTGKWIEDKGQQTLMQNFIERGEVWRVCSVCGAGHMIGHKYAIDKAYHDRHHNFCPNCGADMRTAEQIVHDAIDNTPMAEDAYPGIKERLHKAVDDMREVTNGN